MAIETTRPTIVELVNRCDSEYFIDHPTVEWFHRSYVPGEVDPDVLVAAGVDLSGDTYVEVRQIAPGIRSRLFMTRRSPEPKETRYAA